jgi:hypothetical protein
LSNTLTPRCRKATELGGTEDTHVTQAHLGADWRAEEPNSIKEVGTHEQARGVGPTASMKYALSVVINRSENKIK